jgi:hypothetical protein
MSAPGRTITSPSGSTCARPLTCRAAHGGVGGILLRRRGAAAAAGAPQRHLQQGHVGSTGGGRSDAPSNQDYSVQNMRDTSGHRMTFYFSPCHNNAHGREIPGRRHQQRARRRRALRRGRAGAKVTNDACLLKPPTASARGSKPQARFFTRHPPASASARALAPRHLRIALICVA